jgi:saccharopine dehydrogenase (NADP+, L-glutamate forming)
MIEIDLIDADSPALRSVLLLGAGFVTRPTAVELDKAGVKVIVGQ